MDSRLNNVPVPKVFLATTLVECCSDYLDTWVVVKAVKMLKRRGENGQKIQADA